MKNPFKHYPIRKAFFITFSIFVTLLLGIIVLVSYEVSINQMQHNTSHYQQKLLREINEQISIQKTSIEEVTLAMTRNSDLQNYLRGQQTDYGAYRSISEVNKSFFNIAFSVPMIDSIHIYLKEVPFRENEGPIRYLEFQEYRTKKWLSPLRDADSSWLRKHNIYSVQGNISVVSYARKVYDLDHEVEGVIVVNVKTDKFQKIMEDEVSGINRLLIDSSDQPITYVGSKEDTSFTILKELKKNQQINLNKDGFIRYEDHFVVWSKLFNTDWLLMEITPWKQVALGSIRLSILLGSIGLLAIGIAIIINYQISRQFTKPIHILLKRMDNFSMTKNDLQLPEDYENEFGSLFRQYKNLMNRIYLLYKDLETGYRQKRKAEVETLQANINPHFLYNTLDQLNWMAIEAGQTQISKVLELTGKMFRIGLSKGESFITIKQEINHLESYLQIQQIRLGKSFRYQVDVDESYLSSYMPKLTLQPFVENSIIHGFHNRDHGMIKIKMYYLQEYFYIVIQDNGVGFHKEKQSTTKTTGGYGIRNVKDRLEAYFGENYSIDFYSEVESGTTVMIKIPKLDNLEKEEVSLYVEGNHH